MSNTRDAKGIVAARPRHPLDRRGLHVGAIGTGLDGRHYRLVAPIQRGGMGELFLAEMVRHGTPPERVVIKRLLADLQDDDKYIKMFRSEAAVMARLQHPNIVKLVDTPIIEHSQCLAMEFVYGRNLQQIIHRHEVQNRSIPPRIALSIIAQILSGLHYAHSFVEPDGRPLQLVHRDVTPGNVLVGYNGAIKLTDFGIAKSKMSLVSTTVGIVKGKARYLAPEQILGEPATPRSDVFSAAVVTVELLTREPLFERDSLPKTLHCIVHGERPELARQLPDAKQSLLDPLERALSTDVRHRPQTADMFAQQLLHAARDFGGPAAGPEIGNYLQSVFHDREPLPPLGTGADLPTIMGDAPMTPSDPLPQVPLGTELDDESVTDLRPAPSDPAGRTPTVTKPAAEADAGPTFIVSGEAADDALVGPGPTVDEAVSALALVQQSRDDIELQPPPLPPPSVRVPPARSRLWFLSSVSSWASSVRLRRRLWSPALRRASRAPASLQAPPISMCCTPSALK